MELPDKEYEVINGVSYCTFRQEVLHCIGLDEKNPYKRHNKLWYKMYRNNFSANKPLPLWEQAVLEGLAFKRMYDDGSIEYRLSVSGIQWLEKEIGVNIR